MFIKRLKPNVYDVFVGNGWNNWTRVVRVKDGVKPVAGVTLYPNQLEQVKARLIK